MLNLSTVRRSRGNGHLEIVRVFAGHHADVDATTHRSSTPMLLALENRHTKVIELSQVSLLRTSTSRLGATALSRTRRQYRMLMGFGADANIRKTTARHYTK